MSESLTSILIARFATHPKGTHALSKDICFTMQSDALDWTGMMLHHILFGNQRTISGNAMKSIVTDTMIRKNGNEPRITGARDLSPATC